MTSPATPLSYCLPSPGDVERRLRNEETAALLGLLSRCGECLEGMDGSRKVRLSLCSEDDPYFALESAVLPRALEALHSAGWAACMKKVRVNKTRWLHIELPSAP